MANDLTTTSQAADLRDSVIPGRETERDDSAWLLERMREFSEDQEADKNNREAALEDLQFVANIDGAQWDATVRANRMAQLKPCLTINTLPQYIGQVIGDMRVNKPAIKVRPAEDADEDLADIRSGLIRSIERQSDATGIYSQAGEDAVTCGIGHFRAGLQYTADDVFDQDIRIQPITNPLSVLWDYMSVERTGADARRCWVVDDLPKKEFERQWPNAIPYAGTELTTRARQVGWMSQDTVKVIEYWRIEEVPQQIAMLDDGTIKDYTPDKRMPDGRPMSDHVLNDAAGRPRIRTVRRKQAVMQLITGTSILTKPYILPIPRVPIFKVVGREVRVGDARVRFGLVRFAKDPVRLRNYWRSVGAELLAYAPKQSWIAPASSVEGREDDFRKAHLSGDPLLVYNDGNEKPERVAPPQFPEAILKEAQVNAQDIKDVTGLHDASLGIQSNETSGKAILARQREGDIATVMYHDNLNASIRACGEVVNLLIPLVYDTARTIRVEGEDAAIKLKRINDPNDPESIDMGKGKFDIVVDTGPSYSTKRVEAAESMLAFVQAVPQAAAVTGDLIAKAQDWPDAEVIADRLKRAIPPQILGEDDAEKSPQEQAAAQAAQQAAEEAKAQAQAMAILATREQEAKTRQAEAEAKKAEAEAKKAEAEADVAVAKSVSAHVNGLREMEAEVPEESAPEPPASTQDQGAPPAQEAA